MIYPAKYNGINFSYDINRESDLYNFENQRVRGILPMFSEFKYLSFCVTNPIEDDIANLIYFDGGGENAVEFSIVNFDEDNDIKIYYFEFPYGLNITPNFKEIRFRLEIEGQTSIYSELYEVVPYNYIEENKIAKVIGYNDDDRHGFLSNQAFGFFKLSIFKSDFFVSQKKEYEYSYSRKKILSSENQIAKRFTFHDLSMYQQNLLKWLCNCEHFSINGVEYQLISEFTEIEADENTEINSLRADFVEVNQSFFSAPSTFAPKNVFQNRFFM